MSEVVRIIESIDWKTLFAGFALLISLYSLRVSKNNQEEERKLKERQVILEVDDLLDKAWVLLGGDIESQVMVEHQSKRELNEAQRLIKRALKALPKHPRALRMMGTYHLRLYKEHSKRDFDLDKAGSFLREALAQNPKDYKTFKDLGVLHDYQGDFTNAKAMFNAALQIEGESPDVLCNLGVCCSAENNIDEATKHFEKAIEIDPNYFLPNCNLSLLYLNRGLHAEALKFAKHAVALAPNSGFANDVLSSAFFHLRDYSKAIKHAEKALERDPRNIGLLNNLAVCYFQVDQIQNAIEICESVLQIAPDNPKAKGNLLMFESAFSTTQTAVDEAQSESQDQVRR